MKKGKVYFNLALLGQYSVHQTGIFLSYKNIVNHYNIDKYCG